MEPIMYTFSTGSHGRGSGGLSQNICTVISGKYFVRVYLYGGYKGELGDIS